LTEQWRAAVGAPGRLEIQAGRNKNQILPEESQSGMEQKQNPAQRNQNARSSR
jgi:hypothetical protein